MKTLKWLALPLMMAGLVGGTCLLSGCEDDPDTSEMDGYFDKNPYDEASRNEAIEPIMFLDPEQATVTYAGQRATFVVRGGEGPYSWKVGDDAVGTVHVDMNDQAIYEAFQVEPNSVIAHDSYGHFAVAQIVGFSTNDVSNLLRISPDTSILDVNNEMQALAVSGGTEPYTWEVSNAERGALVGGNTGSSVVYMRYAAGDNAITVTDGEGDTARAVINQPSDAP